MPLILSDLAALRFEPSTPLPMLASHLPQCQFPAYSSFSTLDQPQSTADSEEPKAEHEHLSRTQNIDISYSPPKAWDYSVRLSAPAFL